MRIVKRQRRLTKQPRYFWKMHNCMKWETVAAREQEQKSILRLLLLLLHGKFSGLMRKKTICQQQQQQVFLWRVRGCGAIGNKVRSNNTTVTRSVSNYCASAVGNTGKDMMKSYESTVGRAMARTQRKASMCNVLRIPCRVKEFALVGLRSCRESYTAFFLGLFNFHNGLSKSRFTTATTRC